MKPFVFILTALSVAFLSFTLTTPAAAGQTVFQNADQYHFCHRCGMAVKKSEKVITVNNVPQGPWHQCCPICALGDIIESAKGNGSIKGYDVTNGLAIDIVISNSTIQKIDPPDTTILFGGSCPKNKFFVSRENALTFIEKADWAQPKMLRTVPQAFAWLSDKKKAITRCAMCSTPLEGHEKTTITIMTRNKKRLVACCAHCGLLMLHKLKDKAIRAVTPDYKTGQLINVQNAHYVVDNDLVVCCFPSTITFARKADAQAFQKQHKGAVMTYSKALANMRKVMGK